MIKALFDIQRIHVDGSKLYYEVFYLDGRSYSKVTDTLFTSLSSARAYIQTLLNE
jgi:hypothetical protein